MKKLRILVVISLCFILSGCFWEKKTKEEVDPNNYVIKLESNPSIGNKWSFEVSDDSIVDVIDAGYKKEKNVDGTLGIQTYVLKGLNVGTAKVTFKYVSVDGIELVVSDYDISVDYYLKVTCDSIYTDKIEDITYEDIENIEDSL